MKYTDRPTEYKAGLSVVPDGGIDGRLVKGLTAIIGNIDSGQDRIFPRAFSKTLKENGHRVKHLWMHEWLDPPTAAIKELKEVRRQDLPEQLQDKYPEAKGGLLVVRKYLETNRGEEILQGLKEGAINEMSFGYDPIKFDFEELKDEGIMVRNLREVRLWDTSDVTWGMNALTEAVVKSPFLTFKSSGVADLSQAWKSVKLSDFTDQEWEELSQTEVDRISAHFTWSKNWPPENFNDLILPHHQPTRDGVGKVVWRGVQEAYWRLLKGTNSLWDMPSLCSIHNHLKQHCNEFNKNAPELPLIILQSSIQSFLSSGQITGGDLLDKSHIETIKKQAEQIAGLLAQPMPVYSDSLLTETFLMDLRLREMEIQKL